MPSLLALAESFLLLGKAINPQAVTNVHFDFDYLPSDLPSETEWKLKVTLSGTKELTPDGTETVLAFTQEVTACESTETEAVVEVHKRLANLIDSFVGLRKEELAFAEQAVMTVHSEEGDLTSLWSQGDAAPGAEEMGTAGEKS
jgi:hypothetical protein